MNDVRRLTTPEQTFFIDIDPSNIIRFIATYQQNGVTVLEKEKNNMTFTQTTDSDDCGVLWAASFTMTQTESKSFAAGVPVEIQIRILDKGVNVVASDIWTAEVSDVLNETVLTT